MAFVGVEGDLGGQLHEVWCVPRESPQGREGDVLIEDEEVQTMGCVGYVDVCEIRSEVEVEVEVVALIKKRIFL